MIEKEGMAMAWKKPSWRMEKLLGERYPSMRANVTGGPQTATS